MSDDRQKLQNVFAHSTSTHTFEIRWVQTGDPTKPPLVFLHGTPWSSIVWHDLASSLQTQYCIYLYDHPGFGLSPQPSRHDGKDPDLDPSLELRAEASAALFRHWNLTRPPHIVAHDNAGLVSLRLYLQHGIRFASLCLIDVVAIGPFGTPLFKLIAENQLVFEALPPSFLEGITRSYIKTASHKGLDPEIEDMLAAPWLENGSQGPKRFLQEMIQAHHRHVGEIENEYANVGKQIPIKIMWGKNETWIPPERGEKLYKALNAKELVLVEEANHLILYDQPSRLVFELTTWLHSCS